MYSTIEMKLTYLLSLDSGSAALYKCIFYILQRIVPAKCYFLAFSYVFKNLFNVYYLACVYMYVIFHWINQTCLMLTYIAMAKITPSHTPVPSHRPLHLAEAGICVKYPVLSMHHLRLCVKESFKLSGSQNAKIEISRTCVALPVTMVTIAITYSHRQFWRAVWWFSHTSFVSARRCWQAGVCR